MEDVPELHGLQGKMITLAAGEQKEFSSEASESSFIFAKLTAVGLDFEKVALQLLGASTETIGKPIHFGNASITTVGTKADAGSRWIVRLTNGASAPLTVELVTGSMISR